MGVEFEIAQRKKAVEDATWHNHNHQDRCRNLLIDAAEEVVTRLAIVRAGRGAIGGIGMLSALEQLAVACDAYEPEEMAWTQRRANVTSCLTTTSCARCESGTA
jgi:tRNA(Ile2) C34 agmatinyltransferase TiaS